jgi:hypothetical protein
MSTLPPVPEGYATWLAEQQADLVSRLLTKLDAALDRRWFATKAEFIAWITPV